MIVGKKERKRNKEEINGPGDSWQSDALKPNFVELDLLIVNTCYCYYDDQSINRYEYEYESNFTNITPNFHFCIILNYNIKLTYLKIQKSTSTPFGNFLIF